MALFNFWALARTVRRILLPGARAPRLLAAAAFGARLALTGALAALALWRLPAHPIGLVLGLLATPAGLAAGLALRRDRSCDDAAHGRNGHDEQVR